MLNVLCTSTAVTSVHVCDYCRCQSMCMLMTTTVDVNVNVVADVSPKERLDALQAAILLLPDENREVLQCLLSFLADMALSAAENQVLTRHMLLLSNLVM